MSRVSFWMGSLLALAAGVAAAQQPASPDTRKEDIEPAVNTSAPANSSEAPAPVGAPAPSRARTDAKPASAAPQPAPATPPPGPSDARSGETAKPRPAGAKGGGKAIDRLELDTTEITGNRELPKVLYIVPWKRSDLGDMVGKPVNSLLDEVLQPVDRDVFQRENRYYRALTPPGGVTGAAAPPASGTAPSASATPNGSAARDEK